MDSGVYAIVNRVNWRSYVGSSVNLSDRYQDHLRLLRRNLHDNKDLQSDFNEFGENKFALEILEFVSDNQLLARERYWYYFGENLYNKTPPVTKIFMNDHHKKLFWNNVDIKTENECWLWTKHLDKDGYGRINYTINGQKLMYRTNRVAYFLTYPDSKQDIVVRHTCDNSSCCNPKHLISGSLSQNAQDRIKRDKTGKYFTDEQIKIIRDEFQSSERMTRQQFCDYINQKHGFNLTYYLVSSIILNKRYYDPSYVNTKGRHFYQNTQGKKPDLTNHGCLGRPSNITKEHIIAIRNKYCSNSSI